MPTHKEAFYKLLERKTGWGRNEIKKIYEEAEKQTENNLEARVTALEERLDTMTFGKITKVDVSDTPEENDNPPW